MSARDYAAMERGGVQLHPHGVRQLQDARYVLFQVWEWEEEHYRTTLYVVTHRTGAEPVTQAVQTTYYAVSLVRLGDLMEQAGFAAVTRLDDCYYQPVLVGHRPAVG